MPLQLRRILIVDDEPNMLHMLRAVLSRDGFETECADSGQKALELASKEKFDFILSDVRMPGMDGMQLLEDLRERGMDTIVIIMSAYGNVELALEAMRKGAYDYISKPFKTDEVVLTLRKAAERERLRREVVHLRRRLRRSEGSSAMVTRSNLMQRALEKACQVARFDSSVLLTGESGTGKELMAREIHRLSYRGKGPFVAINCGALAEGLLESELFGHARGAFTGAESDKPGLFEEADGGSLFLDEIGIMPASLQVKLLRVLDQGEIRRVGETARRPVSVRILAATNEDMDEAIKSGRFREDLYYRLNVMHIHLAPLRERREDIIPLVENCVNLFNEKMGLKVKGLSVEARDALLNYPWKGNVRELQNAVERSMILSGGESITLETLPHDVRVAATNVPEFAHADDTISLKKAVKDIERTLITRALNRTGGNRSKAAGLLEISYPSLLRKIKEHGLS